MKKFLIPSLSLFSIILTACGLASTKDGLSLDKNKDYTFEDVSNKNGSMSYEIFVRSFYDSDNDGIGDLKGVEAKLPYLYDMGFKTLWLMPIHPSPTYHGYDVSNYYAVNTDLGTLDDFDDLVATAKNYNIDIMIDMVLNHCSIQNPWFRQSYNDYKNGNTDEDSKADWFNWGASGSTYGGVSYECRFDSSMPDFNLDSESLRAEIANICKFWINHGVKGFRLDATLYYYYGNTTKNNAFLKWLEDTCHEYDEDFYMVGECWQSDSTVNSYYNSTCDSFFRFGTSTSGDYSVANLIKGFGTASRIEKYIQNNEKAMKTANSKAYSSYFLSNHDMDRISKNFDETQNKMAASLLCLMPGTPYMYYGEEIQLVGRRETSPDDLSDVKRRLPMIWSKKDKTGECSFPETNRQDLNNTEQVELGVVDRLNEKFSLLKHYKKVINIRNKYPFIKQGVFTSMCDTLDADALYNQDKIMAYKIALDDEYIIVVHNFTSVTQTVTSPGTEILDEINTSRYRPKIVDGKLTIAPYSSVILH